MVAGSILGKYRLIEQLGQGGMGSVWRAQRLTNQAEVAIKLIDPEFVTSKEAISRFRREAQAAEEIRSTHVVQILDYDVDNDTPFIVMELLKGEDLSKRLRRERLLTPEQTAIILGQVAKAIALAHDHDIVHRDLKPENVFVVREHDEEVVKVFDFGVARHHTARGDSSGLRTKTGMVLGTPYYMSPEQASGREASHLADIWSFAVIAFECITGERAFRGDSFLEVGSAICRDPMPVPSAFAPVPEGFDAWFAQAAARKPSERFQSIRAAADALRTVCGLSSARPSAASVPGQHGTAAATGGEQPQAQEACTETVALNLEATAAPASRSIRGVSGPTQHAKWPMLVSVAAILVIGTALSVHLMNRAGKASSSPSAAGLPSAERVTVTPPAPSAPPKTTETPNASESGPAIARTSGDAGVVQGSSEKPARQHPAAAPSSPRRSGAGARAAVPPAPPAPVSSARKKTGYQPEF